MDDAKRDQEYETALADAAGVVAFVLSRVPPEAQP